VLAALGASVVPAEAHSPVVKGTIKHGGTAYGGLYGERLTIKALKDSGCTAPTMGGTDLNNFDAAVIDLNGLASHKMTATYKTTVVGTEQAPPDGAPASGIFLEFLDKTCAPVALVAKEKAPDPYKVPTAALTVPTKAKWLIIAVNSEARAVNYTVTFKHPPPPPKKKKR
jgi:hypothetical protein